MQSATETSPDVEILLVGPLPPPLGGVSVHVQRLLPILSDAGFRARAVNHFSSQDSPLVTGTLNRNPWNYYRLSGRFPARLVHYHHSRWIHLVSLALGMSRRRSRYLVTFHYAGIQDQLTSRIPLLSAITRWALRRFDAIIAVSTEVRDVIQDHSEQRVAAVIPAFVRPAPSESVEYDDVVKRHLQSGRILLTASYGVQFLGNGRDIYGLDSTIDAFVAIAPARPELRLALFMAKRPQAGDEVKFLQRLERRLQGAGLRERVLIAFGLPFVPALSHDVIFLRPTRIDGDALSVREALDAGVPVIASDAVERPPGAVTYATDDIDALCAVLNRILDLPREEGGSGDGSGDELDEYSIALLRLYEQQLSLAPSTTTSL